MARRVRWGGLAIVGFAAVLGGCQGSVSFDTVTEIPELFVPGDPEAHAEGRVPETMSFSFDLEVDPDPRFRDVRRVTLRALTLTITDTERQPDDVDCWDFLERVTVQIEGARDPVTLPLVTIAEVVRPGCVQTLSFIPVDGVDLRPYLADGARIVSVVTGTLPADSVTFRGMAISRVDAY